jgi:hypothetical protein
VFTRAQAALPLPCRESQTAPALCWPIMVRRKASREWQDDK